MRTSARVALGRSFALLAAAAALGVAGCGSSGDDASGDGAAESGRTGLVVALSADPASLDPQLADDGSERAVNDNIYEMLLTRDPDGNLGPQLAAQLPKQVNAKTWRFKLRDGVKFSNGEPFGPDSVVASIKRVMDPEYASGQVGFFTGIVRARKVDETTVDVMTKAQDPLLPARMAFMKMIPPKHSEDPGFADKPIGTGPYTFVKRIAGEQIQLKANPDYWGGPPKIPEVLIRIISDESARLSALKSGEVDLVTNLSPDYADQVPEFLNVPGAENTNIRLNNQDPSAITSDVRVRQALNYAVDRQAIADKLYSGYARPLKCSTIPEQAFGHNPDLEAYPYDPEKAKQLLQEAGATGKTLKFVSNPDRWLKAREVSQAIVSYWEEAGLKVDLEFQEWNDYLDTLAAKRNKPAGLYHSSTNDLLDADRQIGSYYVSDSGVSAYQNPRIDELAAQARSEPDKGKRLELYKELTQLACDDASMVFLVNIDDTYGTSTRLGFEPRADQRLLYKEMSLDG
jgi:peptide/nickel transport system substrate-binding protein